MITQHDINKAWGAYHLIEDEENWTRGAVARDKKDRPVSFRDAKAVKFCMIGAFMTQEWDNEDEIFEEMKIAATPYTPASINDTSTHTEVLAFLEEFIHSLEGKVQNG